MQVVSYLRFLNISLKLVYISVCVCTHTHARTNLCFGYVNIIESTRSWKLDLDITMPLHLYHQVEYILAQDGEDVNPENLHKCYMGPF